MTPTPTFQLNARGSNQFVVAWPGTKGPKHYLARSQAAAALAKLPDAERFEVWQPCQGRSVYLRTKPIA